MEKEIKDFALEEIQSQLIDSSNNFWNRTEEEEKKVNFLRKMKEAILRDRERV